MNSRELKLLEAAFSAEIEAALNPGRPAVMQTRSRKLADKLVADGYLARHTMTLGERMPMRIEGYMLTEAGRLAYCTSDLAHPESPT